MIIYNDELNLNVGKLESGSNEFKAPMLEDLRLVIP